MFDEEADANEEGAVDANEEGAVDEEADADPGLELDDWLSGGCDGSEEDRVDDQESDDRGQGGRPAVAWRQLDMLCCALETWR